MKICKKNKNKKFSFLYKDNLKLWDKIEIITKQIYRAEKITADNDVKNQLKIFTLGKQNGLLKDFIRIIANETIIRHQLI